MRISNCGLRIDRPQHAKSRKAPHLRWRKLINRNASWIFRAIAKAGPFAADQIRNPQSEISAVWNIGFRAFVFNVPRFARASLCQRAAAPLKGGLHVWHIGAAGTMNRCGKPSEEHAMTGRGDVSSP